MSGKSKVKIRAVIVDDEELARQMLREFLSTHAEIELIAECANGFHRLQKKKSGSIAWPGFHF